MAGIEPGKIVTPYQHATPSNIRKKVKQSRYTPWRRLGGEEV
jgi:hypothetical protein